MAQTITRFPVPAIYYHGVQQHIPNMWYRNCPMLPDAQAKLVLLTGATGYVGGRLLAELTKAG